jgi:Flp pilus assembly protein TadD
MKMLATKSLGRMSFLSLAVVTAASLAACEDIQSPSPVPKPRSAVLETAPVASPTPAPAPPVVAPPPVQGTAPEAKSEPVAEDEKPVDALTAARKLLDEGEVGKALELAKVAVREQPKRSAAWNVLGRSQLRSGKRKDAIEAFEEAVRLNPKNAFARNNLGLALIYDGRYEEAVESLEVAVELLPATAYMWNNLGMAYEQLDRLDDAREAYEKAAEMDSGLAKGSLARLTGVESVLRTAKAEPATEMAPGTLEGTVSPGKPDVPKTVTQ